MIKISQRESQILDLISLGYTDKDIARCLCISPYTANDHRKNLIRKLECKNACALVRRALELEILPIGHAA